MSGCRGAGARGARSRTLSIASCLLLLPPMPPPHAPAHVFDVEEQLRARLEPEAVEVEVLHTARNAAGVQKWQSQLGVPRK